MAYTRQGSKKASTPIPADPGVLSVHITNSAAETNVPVKVPWDGCRLAYAYVVLATAIDTEAACEIDLELDIAGGTEIMTITAPHNSAVGTVTEATFTDESAGRFLDTDNTIMVEVDGSAAAAGTYNLYMYFEPDTA